MARKKKEENKEEVQESKVKSIESVDTDSVDTDSVDFKDKDSIDSEGKSDEGDEGSNNLENKKESSIECSNVELLSIKTIISNLSKPIPERFIKYRTQGGKTFPTMNWVHSCLFLDLYAPGWSYRIKETSILGQDFVVTVAIDIPCKEGIVSRSALGWSEYDKTAYGGAPGAAEAQALKRAAAKFGLGLYLYTSDKK